MKIGLVGLGRMGGNIARRLMQAGHQVVAWDRSDEAVQTLAKDGAEAATGWRTWPPSSPIRRSGG